MENYQLAIKASDDGKHWNIRGYAVLFDIQDLVGTKFTRNTDFWEGMTSGTPPLLFDHGLDPKIGLSFVGQVKKKGLDEIGIWFEAQMDRANRYADAIAQMIRSKRMGVSTGTSPHTMSVDDGIITSWPILEISLTPTPAEPATIGHLAQKSFSVDAEGDGSVVTDDELAASVATLLETLTGAPASDVAIRSHLGLARSVFGAVISSAEPSPAPTGKSPADVTEDSDRLGLEIEFEKFRQSHSAVAYT